MKRNLSLVLDEKGLVSLTLYSADNVSMDEYTTKKFANSDEVRKKYKKEIDKFLIENEQYLNEIKEKKQKDFNGRIVLLQVDETNNELIEKKVLYKKHIVAFKQLCNDQGTMQEFSKLEKIGYNSYGLKRLVSLQVHKEISYSGTFKIKSRTDYIQKELKKNKDNFYEILRIMLKAYKNQRTLRPNLPTIDKIYKDYLENKNNKKNNQDFKIIYEYKSNLNDTKSEYNVDGIKYFQEEQELFDLDYLEKIESDFTPDGLGGRDKVIK